MFQQEQQAGTCAWERGREKMAADAVK